MSEGQEEPTFWKPDISFYQSDPRSKEIREICIPAINALNRLLHDPGVGKDSELRLSLYSQLEEVNGRLVELGIRPGMHLGKPLEAFQGNSVTAAEFLASQLIPLTGRNIPSESDAAPIIEEFTEEKSENVRIFDSQALPGKANDFRTIRGVVAFIEENFDIKSVDDKGKDS